MGPKAVGPNLHRSMSLRLTTAGESHGPGLTCILEGLPAGLRAGPRRRSIATSPAASSATAAAGG